MVIHRRLRPRTYGPTDRRERRIHANTCYEQQVRLCVRLLGSPLYLLLFPPAASFPLGFSRGRDPRSIRLPGLAGSSFCSVLLGSVVRIARRERGRRERNRERQRERESTESIAAGFLGRLQTSRIRQIQLTQTELETKESVRWRSAGPPFLPRYLLALPSYRLRSSCSCPGVTVSYVAPRSPFPPTESTSTDIRLRTRREKLARRERRERRGSMEFLLRFSEEMHARTHAREAIFVLAQKNRHRHAKMTPRTKPEYLYTCAATEKFTHAKVEAWNSVILRGWHINYRDLDRLE